MQQDENEMLKKLLLSKEKTGVRVADFLLKMIDEQGESRQDFVNIAVLEKIVKESRS